MKVLLKILTSIVLFAALITTSICLLMNYAEEHDSSLTDVAINRHLLKGATFYERYIKRVIDIVIAFGGLLVTFPFVAIAGILIYIEDPGNIIFKQKRVGINKSYFYIHKLRSMKQNTGDIPTHLLSQEEQRKMILKIGRFIRKTSIDEFAQMIDILRHRMTLVGPRPALWNQYDLIAERDKYCANDVLPGLTGLAQISGRDELEILVKAKLDGEYVRALRESSWSGFRMDCKCFLGTFASVIFSKGVIEGGTGSASQIGRTYTKGKTDKELIGQIGFGEAVEVDRLTKKKVLITGAGSYIGKSFMEYVKEHYINNFEITELDMMGESWKEKTFSEYDIIYHVAGIAHADVGNVSDQVKNKYYEVNTDLTVEVAKKAKQEGVKEFIFMSSMIVYGDSAPYGKKKVIDENTVPVPVNFYGDSKLQADMAVRDLASNDFKVIVLRPPMIYGAGSKGNYRTLVKLAKKLPVFPDVENERSMLFIGNLCEFLCQIMLIKEMKRNAVVLVPQNVEWTKTSVMVKEIAEAYGKRVVLTKLLRPAVAIVGKMPGKIGGMVSKAFGNSCYLHDLSEYEGVVYTNDCKR